MKHILNLVCLSFAFLLITCNRAEDEVFDRERDFLKSVRVEGATTVAYDKEEGIIQVTLPESYTKDILYLDLETYQDATLQLNPWDDLNSPNRVGIRYRGTEPITFTVQRQVQEGTSTKGYKVYVEHLGKLTASLVSDLRLGASYEAPYEGVGAYFKLNSGMGTIPEKPGSKKQLVPKLTELSSGTPVSGSYYASLDHFLVDGATPISLSSEYSLELQYGEKKFTFPGRLPLKRADVIVAFYDNNSMYQTLPKARRILLTGGYFLPDKKYRIEIESAFYPSRTLTAEYINPSALGFQIPSEVADGSYRINIYEDESLLTSPAIHVAGNASVKGIRKISGGSPDCSAPPLPGGGISKNPSFQRGKSVFVAPFPIIATDYRVGFDATKQLPDLELKGDKSTTIIKAKTQADYCYADGTAILYYGGYTVPADMAPGSYQAKLVYPETVNSVPFWTLITIK